MLISTDKSDFLIGEASHGHFQIEMACQTCHESAFGGQDVLQNACINCHGEELERAHDSHPKKKFTDPREAFRIEILDARYCVSCHTEHQKEKTRPMGVTLPDDYCYHCHQEVVEDRESHKNLPFDSCASAGCHNFHDNRALYESFLLENASQPWLLEVAKITNTKKTPAITDKTITVNTSAFKKEISLHPDIAEQWHDSAHALAGVDCGGCHLVEDNSTWLAKPGIDKCQSCHKHEVETFTEGKHGMRLARTVAKSLSAISPTESELTFRHDSMATKHSCNSCHKPHQFDTKYAAVEGCLSCHADNHSLNYKNSPHAALWQQQLSTEADNGTGVSCATCHMPRLTLEGSKERKTFVNHNQNDNLRPNEKMIRSVCMDCHGLRFSIDALADQDLIDSNFNGKPSIQIKSIDWAVDRDKKN